MATSLSRELWNLYKRLGGIQNESFDSYLRLPSILVQAAMIIDAEIARINTAREEMAERQNKYKQ